MNSTSIWNPGNIIYIIFMMNANCMHTIIVAFFILIKRDKLNKAYVNLHTRIVFSINIIIVKIEFIIIIVALIR